MKPKVPQSITDYLCEIDLTLWACQHPHIYVDEFGEPTKRPRADKTRVVVQLAGPNLEDFSPWGEGPTVGDAVRAAMSNIRFRTLRPGLDGALARLEVEMSLTHIAIMCKTAAVDRVKRRIAKGEPVTPEDLEDDIPF